jgi:hypothetical protein
MPKKLRIVVFVNQPGIAALTSVALRGLHIEKVVGEDLLPTALESSATEEVLAIVHPRDVSNLDRYVQNFSSVAWVAMSNEEPSELGGCTYLPKETLSRPVEFRANLMQIARDRWPGIELPAA